MAKKGGNPQNLDPVRTKEEARKRGRAGGIASGRARQERKSWKETAENVLKMALYDGKVDSVFGAESITSAQQMNLSIQDRIIISLSARASQGDVRAIELIMEIIGESSNKSSVSPLDGLAETLKKYKDEEEDDD